jgi:hypothetical protein
LYFLSLVDCLIDKVSSNLNLTLTAAQRLKTAIHSIDIIDNANALAAESGIGTTRVLVLDSKEV